MIDYRWFVLPFETTNDGGIYSDNPCLSIYEQDVVGWVGLAIDMSDIQHETIDGEQYLCKVYADVTVLDSIEQMESCTRVTPDSSEIISLVPFPNGIEPSFRNLNKLFSIGNVQLPN